MQSELRKKYKEELYKKIHFNLLKNREVLDIGCGDGEDSFNLSKIAKKVIAFDVEEFQEWEKYKNSKLSFEIADAQNMPFKNKMFDGVLLKDVLHHVKKPEKVLKEIERVTKNGSIIILIEANRYNPLFYIHMTKMLGHEHLTRKKFKALIKERFINVAFYHFESHFYPNRLVQGFLKLFQLIMEKTSFLNNFLSYNTAIVKK